MIMILIKVVLQYDSSFNLNDEHFVKTHLSNEVTEEVIFL